MVITMMVITGGALAADLGLRWLYIVLGLKQEIEALPTVLLGLLSPVGYENVFSEGLKTLFTSKDALIALSSSGSSQNIRNAATLAKEMGGRVLTFSGFKSDNPLRSLGDYNFWLNSSDYGKVEIP